MKTWVGGFAGGVLLTIVIGLSVAWIYRIEILNLASNLYGQRIVGQTKVLLTDGVLYQDGVEVGVLRRGTRLMHRLQTESLEEFYLPIGWEDTGKMAQSFDLSVEKERAFVILETEEK